MVIVFLSKSEVRYFLFIMGLCYLAATVTFLFQNYQVQGKLSRLTVVIDPGHGGVDGGAQDKQGNLEKNINLQIGLKVAQHLRESGLKAVMTRDTDTDLAPFRSGKSGRHRRDLLRRIELALKLKSLFFVSIHCDSSVATQKQGAFVFFNWHSAASKGLAVTIMDEINLIQARPGKIVPGKYLVIRQPGVIGVLVEVGYLSNPAEAALLRSESYQTEMGLAIARGILKYTRHYLR